MKYTINIQGMHCSGCKNLIKISLEDLNYTNVKVDLENNSGEFSSEKNLQIVENELTDIFKKDLHDYSYSNLNQSHE